MQAQPEPDDAELVARSRRRDCDAFGALVERHHSLVFGVALARTQDPALAEDVAQEAFVAAWRDLERLRDGDRVGSWVAGIARNLAATAARTRARRQANAPPPVDATAPSPEDAALEREDRELLARALADLPAAHREAIVLYYLEGQPIARIAAALDVSEDVIKQRLSRGRRGLRTSVASRVDAALARAGVVAAITAATATTSRAAAAAGTAGLVTMNKLAIAAAAAALLAGGAIFYTTRADEQAAPPPAPAVAAAAPAPAAAAEPQAGVPRARRLSGPEERTQLLVAIRAARERRERASAGVTATGAATATSPNAAGLTAPPPVLDGSDHDKNYIRDAVKAIVPMMLDCFEEGLARIPGLTGNVKLEFTIEGEPDVGGLVTTSVVRDTSTIVDPTVRECMQETIYAIEVPPPADGGVVTVAYPFFFRPNLE